MKGIKYIISFLILFIGMLIIGESHIFYLNNFYTEFDNTTIYLQPNTTDKEMVTDILASADRHGVEVFTFIRSPRSTFLTEFEIYGTNGVKEYITENMNISEKTYSSLFLGKVHFSFDNMNRLTNMKNLHDFYVIGDNDDIHAFKMDLIDKYAGNHPKEGTENTELRNNLICIWSLIIGIILLLSFYDVMLQKKENLIRISMGERISKIILRNILIDSLVFSLLFITVLLLLSHSTNVYYMFGISLLLFGILLILNSLLYLNLYVYDLKEVFSTIKGSKKLLSLNYTLKLITTVITIFIISSNVAIIFESISFYKQKDFFENHADYYYTRLEYKPKLDSSGSIDTFTKGAIVQETFYQTFFEQFDATLLTNISNSIGTEGIYANIHALDYLSGKITELKAIDLSHDIYFVLPERFKDDENIIERLKSALTFYEGPDFNYDSEVIYYDHDVHIIRIDENQLYGSELVENPVIIYNNMKPPPLESHTETDLSKINFVHDIMYKISDDEFNRFVEENGLQDQIVSKTNVLENYKNKWTIAKRVLYMNLVFSLLILFLELIIISSIIKLEYEVNAIELSIKKVMGYSIFEKNKKLVLMTVITTITSIIAACIVAFFVHLDEIYYLAVGGAFIMIVESFVIIFYIRKVEAAKIQKILKGGNL